LAWWRASLPAVIGNSGQAVFSNSDFAPKGRQEKAQGNALGFRFGKFEEP
jgi:hypothetical protein